MDQVVRRGLLIHVLQQPREQIGDGWLPRHIKREQLIEPKAPTVGNEKKCWKVEKGKTRKREAWMGFNPV
jgi:hypothetical protein